MRPPGTEDPHNRLQTLGMADDLQEHPLALRRIDDLKPTHDKWRRHLAWLGCVMASMTVIMPMVEDLRRANVDVPRVRPF
ncbi:hypothetical protein GCM10007874_29880 [Labrys miyagiensis]|uniref:Uncharacterized protein n=1 Tax=Labrys miyagiensis TaxID=346912 RepID=A0ABQ6CP26_9HYPH|nr:hypothetical protein GCM10007874_29880 [Labrys miyagiensis]